MAPTAQLTKEHLHKLIDKQDGVENSEKLAADNDWDHEKVLGLLKSLAVDEQITMEGMKREGWKLSAEGEQYSQAGAPEVQVFNLAKSKGGSVSSEDMDKALGATGKVGVGMAIKNKWVSMDKSKTIQILVDSVEDSVKGLLCSLDTLNKEQLDGLKKRKLIQATSMTSYKCNKTVNFSLEAKRAVGEITKEMLVSGSWKTTQFKAMNFSEVSGTPCQGGHFHPLAKVIAEMRLVLTQMGFEEMRTNRWVESSFWNFDTLFQPQQHPARDAHDTFFIKAQSRAQDLPADYLARVKDMHEHGGQGSIGWRYDWSEDEARKNLLRTHTTAVSARTLHAMGEEYVNTGIFTAKKCFSIDRVFRNETLDATHLAEFHQIEGFVADRNLGLGHLIGVLKEFFARIGISKLRFKPAYNPYTEPSMEIFGFHPALKKWIEVGNSGVFRPEMLLPMRLPEDVSVVAWGIGVERWTALLYNIRAIKDLFSFEQKISDSKKNPVCWMKRAAEE